MTLGAFTHKKEILQSQFEEDTKKIHQGALIMIIPFLTFAGIALKPEKKMAQFSQFQFRVFPCHASEGAVSMPKYSPNKHNWTIIFGIHSMRESNFKHFKKIASSVTNGNFLIFSRKRSRFLPFPAQFRSSFSFLFLKVFT